MPESTQHKLDRVRRPRVQITYDVETLGSIVKTELPFVVGIMADLSGNTIKKATGATAMKDRKYVEIDRDNFDSIMEKVAPSAALTADSGFAGTELTFTKLEDFNPINVLRNVPALKRKFESRTRLSNLVAKLDGNVELQKEFVKSFNDLMAQGGEPGDALVQYLRAMNPTPGTPSVTDAETTPGTQTTSGLVITPSADAVGKTTTHFKISGVTGGKLYKSDGKTLVVAAPATDAFITLAEGADGLRFTPTNATVKTGSFKVQPSADGTTVAEDAPSAIATITVKPPQSTPVTTPGTPSVTDAETTPGTQTTSGLVITPSADAVGKTTTHFKISGVTGGSLFKSDGTTPVVAASATDAFITLAEGAAGLRFTPTDATVETGSFKVQPSADGTTVASDAPSATATITVTRAAATAAPTVANATTARAAQTAAMVITPPAGAAGSDVTHFKITAITGGTLFQNDGTTEVREGFITKQQGADGLKFTPDPRGKTDGSFTVQASTDGTTVASDAPSATATITVKK